MFRWLLALVLPLLCVATACTGADPGDEAPSASPTRQETTQAQRYVALGDSYTAAPYVQPTDLANGCLRSSNNYPHLLAAELDLSLTDVSCGGARTEDLRRAQPTYGSGSNPPQLRAVTQKTDLVTVGLGANDADFFADLARSCPITGPGGDRFGGTGRCGYMAPATSERLLSTVGRHLTKVLGQITEAAPQARVLLIGYPALVGNTTCAALPIDRADLAGARQLTRDLRDTMRAAAQRSGVEFVDVWAASRGHEVCSATPWVQGVRTDTARAAALHPRAAGQHGVAQVIAAHLEKPAPPRR